MKIYAMIFVVAVVAISNFASVLGRAQASVTNELLLTEWNEFKVSQGKEYPNSAENERRFQTYLTSRLAVAKHNHEYALGLQSYRQEINKFADMALNELFVSSPPKISNHDFVDGIMTESNYSAPFSLDWRDKGVVTRVKDQGKCNAGWAFSVIGAIESANAINNGKLVELSEQESIDCYEDVNTRGCRYGDTGPLLAFLRDQGVMDAKTYPYTGKQGTCMFNASSIAAKFPCVMGVGPLEDVMRQAVAEKGPTTVGISLTDSFYRYKDGIYSDQVCTGMLQHYVLVVGYGRDDKQGADYWIVKNSWSDAWGDKGYMKIARNKNTCGINQAIFLPTYDPEPQ